MNTEVMSEHEVSASERSSSQHRRTGGVTVIAGIPLHLSFTRPYTVPHDVDWGSKSLARRLVFLYADSDVAAQFRAFLFRTLTSAATGSIYGSGACFIAVLNLAVGYNTLRIVFGCVGMILMAVDVAIHMTRPVTPFWGTARHCIAIAIVLFLAPGSTFVLSSLDARCDEALNFHTTALGRRDFSHVDLPDICSLGVQAYSISALLCACVGLMLHPFSHAAVLVLLVAYTYLGRLLVPDRAEAPRDMIPKILVSCAAAIISFAVSAFRCLAAMDAFEQTIRVEAQRREAASRADEIGALLESVVPAAVLPRLTIGGEAQFSVDTVPSATVLFADMKGFTAWSSSRMARDVAAMLSTVVAAVDRLEQSTRGVEKVKTIGDAYWAVAGIPCEMEDHADQIVTFAHGMNAAVAMVADQNRQWGSLQWRIGVHTGPLSGALFGAQQVSYEVFGPTALIAQKVESSGVAGAVCVTSQTVDALLIRPDASLLRAVCTLPFRHLPLDMGPTVYPSILRLKTEGVTISSTR